MLNGKVRTFHIQLLVDSKFSDISCGPDDESSHIHQAKTKTKNGFDIRNRKTCNSLLETNELQENICQ